MVSLITEGVQVSVETFYQQDYSNPLQNEYMFAYRVTIRNRNVYPVKLHSRVWNIFDSDGVFKVVEGDGVVGMQPVIKPFDEYQYVSGCNLHTEMGRMHGKYSMENLKDNSRFEVKIPAFEMIVPYKYN